MGHFKTVYLVFEWTWDPKTVVMSFEATKMNGSPVAQVWKTQKVAEECSKCILCEGQYQGKYIIISYWPTTSVGECTEWSTLFRD